MTDFPYRCLHCGKPSKLPKHSSCAFKFRVANPPRRKRATQSYGTIKRVCGWFGGKPNELA